MCRVDVTSHVFATFFCGATVVLFDSQICIARGTDANHRRLSTMEMIPFNKIDEMDRRMQDSSNNTDEVTTAMECMMRQHGADNLLHKEKTSPLIQ